jgi:hypothetical protein
MKITTATLLLLPAAISLTAPAATVDECIAEGRTALFAHDVETANTKFEQALTIDADNSEANVFCAVTGLGVYITSSDCGDILTKLGGSDLFWDPTKNSPLRGTDPDTLQSVPASDVFESFCGRNNTIIPDSTTFFEIITGLNDSAIDAIDAAEAHLAKFTSGSSDIVITSDELDANFDQDMRIDYGDILLVRSALQFVAASARLANGYDSDAEINTVVDGEMEDLLNNFQDALKVRSANDWADVRARFEEASELYDAASDYIRNRIDNDTEGVFHIVSDANYDETDLGEDGHTDVMESDEDEFRTYLDKIIASFDATETETYTKYEVDGYDMDGYENWVDIEHTFSFTLAPLVDGDVDLRTLLPELHNGSFVRNTFPDPTMDGLLPDMDQGGLDSLITGDDVDYGWFTPYENTPTPFDDEYIGGWFGYMRYFPDWECQWYYSYEHGYFYPDFSSGSYWLYQNSVYIYVADFGNWVFTSEDFYPWMYRYSSGGGTWLYYWKGQSASSRWYYDYSSGQKIHVTE